MDVISSVDHEYFLPIYLQRNVQDKTLYLTKRCIEIACICTCVLLCHSGLCFQFGGHIYMSLFMAITTMPFVIGT